MLRCLSEHYLFSYEAFTGRMRTFTYRQMKNDYVCPVRSKLDDSIAYQAYHETTSYEVTDQAVADTAGTMIALDGEEILGIEQDPKKEVKEELAS